METATEEETQESSVDSTEEEDADGEEDESISDACIQ